MRQEAATVAEATFDRNDTGKMQCGTEDREREGSPWIVRHEGAEGSRASTIAQGTAVRSESPWAEKIEGHRVCVSLCWG